MSLLAMGASAAALDKNKGLEAALQDSHAACDARHKELQEALTQLVRCWLTLTFSQGLTHGTEHLAAYRVSHTLFACQSCPH